MERKTNHWTHKGNTHTHRNTYTTIQNTYLNTHTHVANKWNLVRTLHTGNRRQSGSPVRRSHRTFPRGNPVRCGRTGKIASRFIFLTHRHRSPSSRFWLIICCGSLFRVIVLWPCLANKSGLETLYMIAEKKNRKRDLKMNTFIQPIRKC